MKTSYLSLILILLILLLMSACSGLVQLEQEKSTTPPPAVTKQTALETVTAVKLIQTTVTPTIMIVTPTPKPAKASFQVTPKITKTASMRNPSQNLQVTLDKTKLEPPVQGLVYMTTDRVNNSYSERISTFWRTDPEDISKATQIITISHQREYFPDGVVLSPDGKFLVYGQEYNKRTRTMQVWLLDIDQKSSQAIDQDAAPQANTQPFIWSSDSTSIVYTKVFNSRLSTELHRYSLNSEQVQLLLKANGFINLVGWNNSLIYYLPLTFSDSQYVVNSYDFDTGQVENVLSFSGENSTDYIQISPNGELALFNYIVVDLQAKTQIAELSFGGSLWSPDSRGLLETTSKATASSLKLSPFNQQIAEKLIIEINQPSTKIKLIAWSPDGQYLIYRDLQTDLYYLLNLISGHIQRFEQTSMLTVGGWVSQ